MSDEIANILNFSRDELPRINASGDQSVDNHRKKKITNNVHVECY